MARATIWHIENEAIADNEAPCYDYGEFLLPFHLFKAIKIQELDLVITVRTVCRMR